MAKKILFVTGTRADFGKMKTLIKTVEESPLFEYSIFVTGMHTLSRYGYTVDEINDAGFANIHIYMNQFHGEPMDFILANTINGFSRYVKEYQPDLVVLHGDRVEALAAAIVGSLNNIRVAHIEGGELSGTIDGTLRHAISKLSHLHLAANEKAAERLKQMGEDPKSIFVIGSPDIDIMLHKNLPDIDRIKRHYGIDFNTYAIALLHPVTTELSSLHEKAEVFVSALVESQQDFIVIYPNNDEGCNDIFKAYNRFKGNKHFRLYPSIRFEYFLTLLKNAEYIIGNSSAGIREAPVYGKYSINVGSRQNERFIYHTILNVDFNQHDILAAISGLKNMPIPTNCYAFGDGNSARKFREMLEGEEIWQYPIQKQFYDLN